VQTSELRPSRSRACLAKLFPRPAPAVGRVGDVPLRPTVGLSRGENPALSRVATRQQRPSVSCSYPLAPEWPEPHGGRGRLSPGGPGWGPLSPLRRPRGSRGGPSSRRKSHGQARAVGGPNSLEQSRAEFDRTRPDSAPEARNAKNPTRAFWWGFLLEQYPTGWNHPVGRFAFFIRKIERKPTLYLVGLRSKARSRGPARRAKPRAGPGRPGQSPAFSILPSPCE